ncbi:phage tail spike protein [Bifidobacterium oedipodis]|uniref:Phage minor structural protein n=1 Tax=Bifidobacterium oedipodis TaxID=2675322 RepID=A0A7Y0EPB6_9BIFI|nr:phage tail spike protein [Bifidobacterium sp. DSM 109957]NMM93862.1 phage minor structural protein [Bifidobacterium sp. DSM 109957]
MSMRFVVYDRWGKPKGDAQNVFEATLKRSIQDDSWSDTLDLRCDDGVLKGDYLIFVDGRGNWHEYWVTSPETIREDGMPVLDVHAVNSLQEIQASRPIIEYFEEVKIGPRRALEYVLDGTRWSVGNIDESVDARDVKLEAVNGWDALQSIADLYGLRFTTRYEVESTLDGIGHRYVDFLKPQSGEHTGKRFEYGRDLKSVRRTFEEQPVYTRLYVYGKSETVSTPDPDDEEVERLISISPVNDGKPYLQASDDVLNQWGMVDAKGAIQQSYGVIVHSDIDTVAALMDQAQEDAKKYFTPQVQYEVDVAAIRLDDGTIPSYERVDVGDIVQIIDTTFSPALRLEGEITGLEEDLLSDGATRTVTVGTVIETMGEYQSTLKKATDALWRGKPNWDATRSIADTAHASSQTAIENVGDVSKVALAANQTAEAANALASQAQATVAQVGTVKNVTFPVASFTDNVCTVTVDGLGVANLVSPYDPLTELAVWDKCKPVFTDHSMQSAVPEGSIRCTCSTTPEKDLRVRVTVLRGA